MTHHCTHCQRPTRQLHPSGYCTECRRVFRCPVCLAICPGKARGTWCRECIRWSQRTQAVVAADNCLGETEPVAVQRGRGLKDG